MTNTYPAYAFQLVPVSAPSEPSPVAPPASPVSPALLAVSYPTDVTIGGISPPTGSCSKIHESLKVTFTVPDSGSVLAKFTILTAYTFDNNGSEVVQGLLDGDESLIPNTLQTVVCTTSGTGQLIRTNFTAYVSGLTPGSEKTWYMGHRALSGTNYTIINQSDHVGTPCFEVWAAPAPSVI